MKKKKSSIIVLSCSESSDDETEKAMPKIDKEELRKYLQNSDEDESPQKTSPKKSKKLLHKRKTSPSNTILQVKQIKPTQKDSPSKYLLQGDDLKRLQKRQKNLAQHLLMFLKEKITNTWLNTTTKRFTSVLPTLKIT